MGRVPNERAEFYDTVMHDAEMALAEGDTVTVEGFCPGCTDPISLGDRVAITTAGRVFHDTCAPGGPR